MEHHFNVEVAEEYGINEAIILENIRFWVAHNEANGTNFYDGLYWTYNSVKAFEALFPYMKPSAIRRALKRLEDEGLIITGNYNKSSYDRTKWYALTDKTEGLFKSADSICQKQQMDSSQTKNGFAQNGEPIPDRKPDSKPNPKHRYGEYDNVLLSDEEIEKLKDEFTDWQDRIERLSAYMASTGKSYKSHLATIRNWARRDKQNQPKQDTRQFCELDTTPWASNGL